MAKFAHNIIGNNKQFALCRDTGESVKYNEVRGSNGVCLKQNPPQKYYIIFSMLAA